MRQDSEPVRLWREKFKLNLSKSWKRDVEVTVTDLSLWKKILDSWGYWKDGKWHRKAPGIKALLDEYERQKFDQQLEASNEDNEASALPACDREGISARSNRYVSQVRSEAERLYFGGGEVDARRLR